jgi:ABC-type amino acid transport substrate-binding protein
VSLSLPRRWLLTLALVASGAVAAQDPVRVGGDPHYPPHHFLGVDGRPQGFDIAVIEEIAGEQSLAISVEFGEWSATLAALERGELDVVPMFISDDRRQRFLFSKPFLRRHHVLYGRPGDRVESLEELAGRRVAVQFGGTAWEWLVNAGTDAVLRPVNEESLVLVEVVRGDADFALLPEDIGRHTLAVQGLEGIEVVGPRWLESDYALGVNPARPELVARLDAGLAAIEANGRLEALRQQWLQPPAAPARRERWSAWWLLPAGLVLSAALAFLVLERRSRRQAR